MCEIEQIPEELWEHCKNPGCNDTGGYPEHDPSCDGSCVNCPIEVQCEFCWSNPKSVFNQRELILNEKYIERNLKHDG